MGTIWKVLVLVVMVIALSDALPTVAIQKRNDIPPAAVAEGASHASAVGGALPPDEGNNNVVPPVKNPALSSLFDDIFNIPIQVLHAVNRLLTNPVNTIGQSTQPKHV